MPLICPICNGLQNLICGQCRQPVDDLGLVHEYLGPYSAYMNMNQFYQPDGFCHHLCVCNSCGPELKLVQVAKIEPGNAQ